jgi:hypothetical protein
MVKSVPMKDHTIVVKPKKRGGGAGVVLLLLALLVGGVGGLGASLFAPASLALSQEHMLGLIHGGIAATDEQTFVDACVVVAGSESPQAVTRTVRTTYYRDGTTLAVTFSSRPTPTITQC